MIESTDATFQNLLGAQASHVFYANLEEYGIPRDMIPERLRLFSLAVEKICGARGGLAIRHEIAKRLYTSLGLNFTPMPERDLPDYVYEAKTIILNRNLTGRLTSS